MHVVVDARISRGWDTGVGRYTVNLLDALTSSRPSHAYTLLVNAAAPPIPLRDPSSVKGVVVPIGVASLAQHARLPLWLRQHEPDVIFSTHPLSAMLSTPCPAVGMVLDLYPIRFPTEYPRAVSIYYRTMFRAAARRMAAILSISEATRKDVQRYLGIDPSAVTVTHLATSRHFRPVADGPARAAVLHRLRLNQPYVLYHGNKRPHKNVLGLLQAFAKLRGEGNRRITLAITGREDPSEHELNFSDLRAEMQRLGLSGEVVFTGFVPDEDLPAVYSGAQVTAIPSFVEGFGLPALESLACGTPVVCSNLSALPEVVGDAGILVDPSDIGALADALVQVLGDESLRALLRARGLARAEMFSWDRTAARTCSVFETVVRKQSGTAAMVKA